MSSRATNYVNYCESDVSSSDEEYMRYAKSSTPRKGYSGGGIRRAFIDVCLKHDDLGSLTAAMSSKEIIIHRKHYDDLIIESAKNHSIKCFKYFIERTNTIDRNCDTQILKHAADSNNIDMLMLVCETYPNVNISLDRHYVFTKFVGHENMQALEFIRSKVRVDPCSNHLLPFKIAIMKNNEPLFRYLYDMNPSVNFTVEDNNLLYEAVNYKAKGILYFILSKTISTREVEKAFEYAMMIGSLEMVISMHEQYPELRSATDNFYAEITISLCKTSNVRTLKWIFETRPHICTHVNMLVYFKTAVEYNKLEMVSCIINQDPSIVQNNESEAIQWICDGGFEPEIVELVTKNFESSKRRKL